MIGCSYDKASRIGLREATSAPYHKQLNYNKELGVERYLRQSSNAQLDCKAGDRRRPDYQLFSRFPTTRGSRRQLGMVWSNALPSAKLHQPLQARSVLRGGVGEGDKNLYILGEIQRL